MKNLTPKQQRFVDEYLIDLNGAQAAIRAGYSARTARQIATEILSKPDIAEAIQEAQEKRSKRTGITQDAVLRELARIVFFDIRRLYDENGNLKPLHMLDDDSAAVLAGMDVVEMAGGDGALVTQAKKVKIVDKTAALTLAMRHLGMLRDKVDVTSNGETVGTGVLVVPAAMSEAEWEKQQG